ncbi:serine/arginine repetitive matrix protein 1-like isoform X2 [Conger conger]|uniref:serine/arginine repetitive matrix protein 1-like isoform X2 n=1 Tax=Conger conger TaxID=82655 RepID=UPI002A5AB2D7|nr:serine/arginine repetitive matrix protein 1-like isoform X2 [Conger conger]
MLKMVRPYSGSPRQKHRPFSQSYGPMHRMDHYGSHSRDQREFREFKALPWREPRGGGPQRGRPPYFDKEPRLADEWREPSQHFHRPLGQWRPQAQGRFHGYGPQTEHLSPEPHRGHRRLSPPRSSQSPPPHRRPPMQAPGNGPPAHKRLSPRVPLHGPHPGPRPPSPHHFHGSLRELSPMAHHGPYRGAHRRPGPSGEDRSRDHGACRDRSPGERLFDRPPRGERWNGGFPRPRSGERRFSNSPQRKSQEFHRRGSYPERLSTEREARRHSESEREMEESRRSVEWAEEGSPHHSYRSPRWKAGPGPSAASPRFHPHHHPPQERPVGRPAKRKHPECRPASPEFERCAKRARETPQRFQRAKVFGGRSLSLKDKSRLLKGRKLRAESETGDKPKAPPAPKPKHPKAQPPKEKEQEEKPCPSVRKARSAVTLQNEQPEAAKARALKKRNPKAAPHKIPSPPDTTCDSPQETETLTIKVDTRHTLTTHSSSPSDRQLSWDLVTVSRRGLGSRPEEKNSAPWRDRAKKTQTTESFFNSHGNITLNERFSKLQNFTSSSRDQSGRYSGLKRQVDVPLLTTKPTKIMGPPQRPSFRPSSPDGKPPHFLRRPFPEPPGHFRRFGYFKRPLMNNLMARPHFQQKPMFRKSQSIMSKYRHLQVLRHRGPTYHH